MASPLNMPVPQTPQPFPAVSLALLQRLDAIFPSRCPDIKWTDREVWAAVGAAGVINRLRLEYNRQNGLPLVERISE